MPLGINGQFPPRASAIVRTAYSVASAARVRYGLHQYPAVARAPSVCYSM
ncbi:hypothetical protein [uncultured Rikenella sp.]|nr:hypothetical protein [uncultured Rikenella sp.]